MVGPTHIDPRPTTTKGMMPTDDVHNQEHDNIAYAKRVIAVDAAGNPVAASSGGTSASPNIVLVDNDFINLPHDQIDLTYVTSGNGEGEIETATYKLAGTTQYTLTISYNADNEISSVVRS